MKKLSDWNGKYLCTVNVKTTRLSETYVREEPDMFCIVTVDKEKAIFPDGSSYDLISFITEAYKTKKCLKEVLEDFIKNDPNLLKSCKKLRVGYTPIKVDNKKSFVRFNQSQMERKFIIKVLLKKKDHKNLQEFKKLLTKKK